MQKTDSLNLNRFVTTAAEFSPSAATKLKAHNSFRVVTFLHRMKIKFGRQIFESFCRLEIFGLVSLNQRRHFKTSHLIMERYLHFHYWPSSCRLFRVCFYNIFTLCCVGRVIIQGHNSAQFCCLYLDTGQWTLLLRNVKYWSNWSRLESDPQFMEYKKCKSAKKLQ